MKKNGFTLIELLGVIVLIGILALITVPAVDTVIKRGKQKAYDMTKDTIINAAKNWLTDNKSLFDDGDTLTLTLADLKEQGYLDFNIKNPSSSTCLDNTMEVTVTRDGKKFNYAIVNEELVDGTEADCEAVGRAPSIYLLGSNPLNVEINSVFNDPGAVATDTDGNDISNKIITTGTVDTSTPIDNLKYKYTIIVDGITKTVSRKINVVDNTAPVITGANNTSLIDTVTSYDLMAGVSATDNSGEAINVVAKGNLSLGVIGKYTITYIATDSSGNTATVTRIITVYSSCFAFDSSTGTITGYTWNSTAKCPMDVVIPSDFGGVPVKYISGNAFDGTGKPNKLTSVDFSAATELLQIKNGGYMEEYGAFRDNIISSVNFGTSSKLQSIGYRAFQKNFISSLNIPNSVTYVGWGSFETNNISSLSIGNSVQTIDNFAFRFNLLNQNGIAFPTSLRSIGSQILYGNVIRKVDLSSNINLTYISQDAFDNVEMDEVVLPNLAIDIKGFNNNNLTSVIIPSNVTSIGIRAFVGNNLTSLTFQSNNKLNVIESNAFYGNKLTSVDLSPLINLKILSGYYDSSTDTKYNCSAWNNTIGCVGAFESNLLTQVTLPSGLTEIGDRAFASNKLASITIPSTVTTFRNYVLADNSFTTFTIPSTVTTRGDGIINKNLISDSTAFMYNSAGTKLISYGGSNKTVTVPNAANAISNIAFYNCGLTSVTLNSTLQTIGNYSFYGNTFTSITIPNSVVSIGAGALPYSLTTVNIDKTSGSITGSPWGATSATINWLR